MRTEEIIEKAVTAYSSGDTGALDAFLADNLCYWINGQPECGKFTCDVTGKPAFSDAVGAILERWDISDYRIVDLIVSGDLAAAQVAHGATHKQTGRQFDTRLALFFAVRDGQITEIVEYHDTAAFARDP
ncbi:nuclear transport factor 2 family protein [Roseovarius sp. B08]|uniref:nuclear transport factor 2 family protein n=1 Tax=Roseovarius sp. B08 TaxID=3449223 RepID=UPI003EDBEC69